MTRINSERFWKHVRCGNADSCWEWVGARRGSNGYGSFQFGSRTDGSRSKIQAHRAAWELAHGPIPRGMIVCHSCDNPVCCNPSHLWLGTIADNVADMIAKGRRRPDICKLTAGNVHDILARHALGNVTNKQLAYEYGVAKSTVQDIVKGRTWKHIATNHQDSEGVTE